MTDSGELPPVAELSARRELLGCFVGLAAVLLLLSLCMLLPVMVAVVISPWLGLVVAVGGFWVWSRFGPRPMPGFLPGILCLWGFAAILGSFIACAVIAIRGWE